MIKRVETVFIKVANLDSSLAWYQDILGLSVKWKNKKNKAIAFQIGETDLTIVEESEVTPYYDSTFNFFVDDIYNFRLKLIDKNLKVSEIKKWSTLEYISFNDLDGNCIEAIHYKKN